MLLRLSLVFFKISFPATLLLAQINTKISASTKTSTANSQITNDTSLVKLAKLISGAEKIRPKWYFISEVTADSSVLDSVGHILKAKSGVQQKLSFKEDIRTAFFQWFQDKIIPDSSGYPLVFHIKKLRLIENRKNEHFVKGEIDYEFDINYRGTDKYLNVTNRSGNAGYSAALITSRNPDSILTIIANDALDQLDELVLESANKQRGMCRDVVFNAYYKTESASTADTIFFNGNKKLSWDDFKADAGGINNVYRMKTGLYLKPLVNYINGVIKINFETGAYMDRASSFAEAGSRNSTLLNHLYYRFKCTWLHAVRLKKQLENEKFTCKNYFEKFQKFFAQAQKQLITELDKFSIETSQGQNKTEHIRWEEVLDKLYNEYEIIK